MFFTLAPLGLIVEDGVKAYWRYVSGPEETSDAKSHKALPYWQQILGLVWTMAWLGVTSTWYFYPQMLRPQNQNLVPFSLADQFGLSVVAGAVVSGGAALALLFRIEI